MTANIFSCCHSTQISAIKRQQPKGDAALGEEMSLPWSDRATKQRDRQTESKSETEGDFSWQTKSVCTCSTLPPSTAKRGKMDETSAERQADHEKQREKQRVAVSEVREKSGKDFKKKKKKRKKDHDGSLHWRVAERQAGEVQHILRQKGTLGLWNIHSSQLETETRSDRAEEGPEDWRDSTTPPKHTLLKIKYTDTFLMTSNEEPGGVVRVSFSSFI